MSAARSPLSSSYRFLLAVLVTVVVSATTALASARADSASIRLCTTAPTPIAMTTMPQSAVIPNVVGMGAKDARTQLQASGFTNLRFVSQHSSTAAWFTVVTTSPNGGTSASIGDEVVVTVSVPPDWAGGSITVGLEPMTLATLAMMALGAAAIVAATVLVAARVLRQAISDQTLSGKQAPER